MTEILCGHVQEPCDELGHTIRDLREAWGLSIRELSAVSGISRVTLRAIERGLPIRPILRTLELLANVFGCDLEHLVRLAGSRPDNRCRETLTSQEKTLLEEFRGLSCDDRAIVLRKMATRNAALAEANIRREASQEVLPT